MRLRALQPRLRGDSAVRGALARGTGLGCLLFSPRWPARWQPAPCMGSACSPAPFDGAGATHPLWVLGAWALAGVTLTVVGHYRDRAKASVPETSALAPVGA